MASRSAGTTFFASFVASCGRCSCFRPRSPKYAQVIADDFPLHRDFLFSVVFRRRNAFFRGQATVSCLLNRTHFADRGTIRMPRASDIRSSRTTVAFDLRSQPRGQPHSIVIEHKNRRPSHRLAPVPVPDPFSAYRVNESGVFADGFHFFEDVPCGREPMAFQKQLSEQ